jgi:hypothetical protein
MWSNALRTVSNAMSFLGPAPFGEEVGVVEGLRLLAGLAGLAGVWLAARAGLRRARSLRAPEASASNGSQVRCVLELYWAASVAVSVLLFATSPLAFDVGLSSTRYAFNLLFAAAVALPLALANLGRRGIVAGAVLAALVALVGLHGLLQIDDRRDALDRTTMVADGPRAVQRALDLGATRGYAGYWNASALRWHTGARVLSVNNCTARKGPTLCPTVFGVPRSLLHPVRDTKSFVLIDHSFLGAPEDLNLKVFGPWESRIQLGGIFLLVYDYDIGTRFGIA